MLQPSTQRNAPVPFVHVEVRPYLVEYVALNLEEIRRNISGVRPDDVYDDPFLVLAVTQGRLPVFNLLSDSSFIHVSVLFEGARKLSEESTEVMFYLTYYDIEAQ